MVEKREFIVLSVVLAGLSFLAGWTLGSRSVPYATTHVAAAGGAAAGGRAERPEAATPGATAAAFARGDSPAPAAAPPAEARPAAAPEPEPDLTALGPAPSVGPAEPLAETIICTDFQCPVCGRAAREMAPIIEKFKDRVRFTVKMNALAMHRRAKPAAIAALAAHRQGRFWPFHDGLFAAGQRLDDADLDDLARTLGLDLDRFARDRADPAIARQVDAESALCATLGARGTPGFFFDGALQQGWGSAMAIEHVLTQHVQAAEALLQGGTPRAGLRDALVRRYASDADRYLTLMRAGAAPTPRNE